MYDEHYGVGSYRFWAIKISASNDLEGFELKIVSGSSSKVGIYDSEPTLG